MQTRYTEILGTPDQKSVFQKRIKQQVDAIALAVLESIGLHDAPYVFRISLRGSARDVQEHFSSKHPGKTLNSHSYASRSENMCFISVADVSLKTLAHELTHVALNLFYTEYKVTNELHEIIAQAVEEKVCKRFSRWFW